MKRNDKYGLARPSPRVAVDAVLFAVDKGQLKVLLIKINNEPYKDMYALPGGLVEIKETLDEAIKRILFQKTNINEVYLEQLYTFGALDRDIRSRAISVAYFALINDLGKYNLKTTSYYSDISWYSVRDLPKMAFDHKQIVEFAHERLKAKINYSNIVYSLLPSEFTLTQMQKVYELILGEKLDKRNFRKKILALELIKETDKKLKGESNRPAKLYKFIDRKLKII